MMNLAGSYIKPDGWNVGDNLAPADYFKDGSFPGCEYRLHSRGGNLAVNVRITGRPYPTSNYNLWKSRCRIEFVGDGEPSIFAGGYIWGPQHE